MSQRLARTISNVPVALGRRSAVISILRRPPAVHRSAHAALERHPGHSRQLMHSGCCTRSSAHRPENKLTQRTNKSREDLERLSRPRSDETFISASDPTKGLVGNYQRFIGLQRTCRALLRRYHTLRHPLAARSTFAPQGAKWPGSDGQPLCSSTDNPMVRLEGVRLPCASGYSHGCGADWISHGDDAPASQRLMSPAGPTQTEGSVAIVGGFSGYQGLAVVVRAPRMENSVSAQR